MLVVEVAGVVVAGVGLLLAELGRRKDPTELHTRKALITLHRSIDDWAELAESVNRIIEINLADGDDFSQGLDPFDGFLQQVEYGEALERQTESDRHREDPASAISTLTVYAPEAKEALITAVAIRRELVQEALFQLADSSKAGDLPLDDLRASAGDLRRAAEMLRVFIAENFQPDS